MKAEIHHLQDECEKLKEQVLDTHIDFEDIESDYVDPVDLRLNSFSSYLANILLRFPGKVKHYTQFTHVTHSCDTHKHHKHTLLTHFYCM